MTNRLGGEKMVVSVAFKQSWVSSRPVTAPANWAPYNEITNPTGLLWTPITQWCRSAVISRGRDRPGNDWQPGSLELELSNIDGRFDPRILDGPYADEDADGASMCRGDTPIKIESIPLTFDGPPTVYPRFAGVTGEWLSERMIKGDAKVPLKAWDMLKWLNLFPLHCTLPEQTTLERIWAILDIVGWPAQSETPPYYRRIYGNSTGSLMAEMEFTGNWAGEEILRAVRTEGRDAFAGIDKEGNFGFAYRHAIYEALFRDSVATFGNTGDNLRYRKIFWVSDERELFNQVKISIAKDGTKTQNMTRGAGAVSFGSTILDLTAALDFDIPKKKRVDFGLARVITVDTAEEGFATITAEPIESDIPAGTTAEYSDGSALAADNESQKRRGKRQLDTSIGSASLAYAQAMAEDMLVQTKREDPTIEAIEVSGLRGTEMAQAIMEIDIGNTVTVLDIPRYATEEQIVPVELTVQGIKDTFGRRSWSTEYRLARRPADKVFWRLGLTPETSSAWGTETILQF
jgi:hypothetical protein